LLGDMELEGRCVGVQVYPGWPEARLRDAFAAMGAGFDPVLPYAYAADEEIEAVSQAIAQMAAGAIDLVAFTSQLQIHRLEEVAERRGVALAPALARTTIAAIGPVTAEAVARAGGAVAIQPETNFHMKPFVAEIVRVLGRG
jgi:uroporphyrinogen-III synthase